MEGETKISVRRTDGKKHTGVGTGGIEVVSVLMSCNPKSSGPLTLPVSPRWRVRPETAPPTPQRKPSPRSSARWTPAGRWRTW